jgi:hypothetical protein
VEIAQQINRTFNISINIRSNSSTKDKIDIGEAPIFVQRHPTLDIIKVVNAPERCRRDETKLIQLPLNGTQRVTGLDLA